MKVNSVLGNVLGIIFTLKTASAVYKCPKSQGRFKYGVGPNCNKYYECINNSPTIKTCPENQGFQEEWNQCLWVGYVKACHVAEEAPLCGKTPEEDQNDKRIETPWIVAVFQRDRTDAEWEYASPGVIVGPTTILTSCRLGRRVNGKWRTSANASSFQVIAGVDTVDLRTSDEFSQTIKVNSIQINPKNDGLHTFCNALMQLEAPFRFNTSYVKPICLPNFKLPEQGRAAFGYSGFGSLTNYAEKSVGSDGFRHLNSKRVGLASRPYCSARTHLLDNFCGVPRPGNEAVAIRDVCTTQAIASVQDSRKGVWYLLGLGTGYTTNVCSIRMIDDDPNLTWIMKNIRCGSDRFPCSSGKCIRLSKVCDTERDCPHGDDEDPKLCRTMNPCINEATFECGVYEKCIKTDNVCDGFPDCYDASDEDLTICKYFHRKNAIPFNSAAAATESSRNVSIVSTAPSTGSSLQTQTVPAPTTTTPRAVTIKAASVLPQTTPLRPAVHSSSANTEIAKVKHSNDRVCPELDISEGVSGKCTLPGGGFSNCSGILPVGTVAQLRCRILYKPAYVEAQFLVKKCTARLHWKPDRSFECFPDCGRLLTSGNNAYIVNGLSLTPTTQFPWHAAIFTKYKNRWKYICGATLIRRSFVLTAAHCVTDYNGDNNKLPEVFKVVLAPTSSKFDTLSKDASVQLFDVKKILVHDRYDPTNNYQSDIAILALKNPAAINPKVIMACLPSSDATEPAPGTIGQVAGFGVDESGKISDALKYANLPVVNTEECIKSVNFIPSVNQFCAGYSNGTGVCFGDSGGGLVFKVNQRYFLYGIVSVGPRSGRRKRGLMCNQKTFSVFTSVARFGEWINYKINFLEIEI